MASQRNDLAEKKKVLIDGVEIPGLVSVGELSLEKGTIDVPGFSRIRKIQNGIVTIPSLDLKYKIERDTSADRFMKDWYYKDETHDVIIVRTDAGGVEFSRTLLPACECSKITQPDYNAESPTYANVTITILPDDVIPID